MYQAYDLKYEMDSRQELAIEAEAECVFDRLVNEEIGEVTAEAYNEDEDALNQAHAALHAAWRRFDKDEIIKAADRVCHIIDEMAQRMAYKQAEEKIRKCF